MLFFSSRGCTKMLRNPNFANVIFLGTSKISKFTSPGHALVPVSEGPGGWGVKLRFAAVLFVLIVHTLCDNCHTLCDHCGWFDSAFTYRWVLSALSYELNSFFWDQMSPQGNLQFSCLHKLLVYWYYTLTFGGTFSFPKDSTEIVLSSDEKHSGNSSLNKCS